MEYYIIGPEVAGGWGEKTRVTRNPGQRVIIHEFDYEFDDWFGDDLLTAAPCFVVTELLAKDIERAQLSGIVFDRVEISKSGIFDDLYPEGRELPTFRWMKIEGQPAKDDFGLTSALELVVSERALAVLRSRQLLEATIEPFEAAGR